MDLIGLAGITIGRFRIHCATGVNPNPLDVFYDGKFKEWQEYQNKRNFECDHIISLINLGGTNWLFAGVYQVHGVQPRSNDKKSWFKYSTSELSGLEHLTGKAIITFTKNFRASYLKGERYVDSLVVQEIKPERQTIEDFPGYNKVNLPFGRLKTVVRQEIKSWKSTLSNVAGVYLIVDMMTGKMYVGCAFGGEGIWQRWCDYERTRHGDNKELRQLLAEKGDEYASNFVFTILEVIDLNASEKDVTTRESHWKDVLLTRKFGYNSN